MRSRVSTLAVLVCTLAGSAFAMNGFGVGPAAGGANNAAVPAQDTLFPYEPWLESAKVGDYVVRKYPAHGTRRHEVKEITGEKVTVEVTFESGGRKHVSVQEFSRNKATIAPSPEYDLRAGPKGQLSIQGKTVNCQAYDGEYETGSVSSGNFKIVKTTAYQKIVGEGVPLGGVLKVLQAPHDGKPMPVNSSQGSRRIKNRITELKLVYEVIEFGNTQEAAKK
ncbi:MAG: hypothetical protein M5U26_02635 [Planctomycetota bacterium]|nr:hypothetical protein [Planctomycetota bacterium]